MQVWRFIATLAAVGCITTACYPPQVQYPYTKLVHSRRSNLYKELLNLLPEDQRASKEAQEEARWLADTSYKAAAAIARINGSHFPGWAGNTLVNSRIQDRGLCWHYQHDMYRELRRRKLKFYRIGTCVRDKGVRSEHNCLYIAHKDGAWPHVWVLDAWMFNGRLRVSNGLELNQRRWKDLPGVCDMLSRFYNEEHQWPVEHWYILRGADGKYNYYYSDDAVLSSQWQRMNANIRKGYREHPGSLTNY